MVLKDAYYQESGSWMTILNRLNLDLIKQKNPMILNNMYLTELTEFVSVSWIRVSSQLMTVSHWTFLELNLLMIIELVLEWFHSIEFIERSSLRTAKNFREQTLFAHLPNRTSASDGQQSRECFRFFWLAYLLKWEGSFGFLERRRHPFIVYV